MNFCLGELILKLLARIGECHQNRSEKTAIDFVLAIEHFKWSVMISNWENVEFTTSSQDSLPLVVLSSF